MIGTIPVTRSAPLDYRYALDAVAAILAGQPPRVIDDAVPLLCEEARQRFPRPGVASGTAVLWIEPVVQTWRSELAMIARDPVATELVAVASRPLARLLPERRDWAGDPLGLQLRGVIRLIRALRAAGFTVVESHGIHSMKAIVLSLLGQQLARLGRPDLGDRLHFAARRAYLVDGPLAPLSTVALIVARKVTLP